MRALSRPVVLAVALGACGGGGSSTLGLVAPAGRDCGEVRTFAPSGSTTHVEPPAKVTYTTNPPTFGPHYPKAAAAGVSETAFPDETLVHNLEHGHVVIGYRGLTEAELRSVREAVIPDPLQVILAPNPRIKASLSLTAWGKAQVCDAIPPGVGEVIRAFVRAHRDHAPESLP